MQQVEAFSMEELELQHGEFLPAREAMQTLNLAHVTAINAAAAVNVHSPHAFAAALAAQKVTVIQAG
jgi:hypothetical protein